MRSSLEKMWGWVFVGLVQLPVAALVGALVGTFDLAVWVMGMVAHHVARSASTLSTGRRFAIWLLAVICGAVTTAIGPALLPVLGGEAVLAVVAIRVALNWLPVAATWGISKVLVLHLTGPRAASPAQMSQVR